MTDKQRRFIEEYPVDFNATAAAIRAGYSEKTAYSQGQRLLKNVEIRDAIDARMDELSMGAAEATKRLTDMARGSLAPFMRTDDDGRVWFNLASEEAAEHLHLIKKIKQKRKRDLVSADGSGGGWETEWVEIELHDAKDAIVQIAKIRGLYIDRVDHTSGGEPISRMVIMPVDQDDDED